ncbi:MAG TPA: TetR/AcrR family transcriptional regulator [Acidimicrobiales bacterium]|nr:TetR/AcrR family transcriptional regulator [Acidimicrobiales bacterium]
MPRNAPEELKALLRDFRRDQIVEVAQRLFGERGTADVSIDDIAAQAGVARSTVYVYFANRDEVLRACLKRMHAQLLDAIASSWEEIARPFDRMRLLIAGILERIDDNPAFFRLALAMPALSGQTGSAMGAELGIISLDLARLIRDVLEEAMVAGDIATMDLDRATTLAGQQLYGAISVRAGHPAPDPIDVAAAEVTAFVWRGLAG